LIRDCEAWKLHTWETIMSASEHLDLDQIPFSQRGGQLRFDQPAALPVVRAFLMSRNRPYQDVAGREVRVETQHLSKEDFERLFVTVYRETGVYLEAGVWVRKQRRPRRPRQRPAHLYALLADLRGRLSALYSTEGGAHDLEIAAQVVLQQEGEYVAALSSKRKYGCTHGSFMMVATVPICNEPSCTRDHTALPEHLDRIGKGWTVYASPGWENEQLRAAGNTANNGETT
jgi:hypothetical protein